jgi:hypothetical protein
VPREIIGIPLSEVCLPTETIEALRGMPGIDLERFMEERISEIAAQYGRPARVNCFLPPNNTPIAATVRQIEHPHGRFRRPSGMRFDVCVMEIKSDPAISPPSAEVFANYRTGNELTGERAVDEKIMIGRPAQRPVCDSHGYSAARLRRVSEITIQLPVNL